MISKNVSLRKKIIGNIAVDEDLPYTSPYLEDLEICDAGNGLAILFYYDPANSFYPTLQIVNSTTGKKVGNKVVINSSSGSTRAALFTVGYYLKKVNENKFCVVFRQNTSAYVYVVAFSVSQLYAITLGTAVLVASGASATQNFLCIESYDTDKILIGMGRDSYDNACNVMVATLSTLTLTTNTWYAVLSGDRFIRPVIVANSNSSALVTVKTNSTATIKCLAISISGSVITAGTAVSIGNSPSLQCALKLENNKFVIITAALTTTLYYGILTISDLTCSVATLVNIYSNPQSYQIALTKYKERQFLVATMFVENTTEYNTKYFEYVSSDGTTYSLQRSGNMHSGTASTTYLNSLSMLNISDRYLTALDLVEGTTNINLYLNIMQV